MKRDLLKLLEETQVGKKHCLTENLVLLTEVLLKKILPSSGA